MVCQALGRQVLRWDVRRASSSRTAGPRDQHESEPTHSDTAAAPHLQPAFLARSHRSYSVEVAEVATQAWLRGACPVTYDVAGPVKLLRSKGVRTFVHTCAARQCMVQAGPGESLLACISD